MSMKQVIPLLALLTVCQLLEAKDPLAELRSARAAMEKNPAVSTQYLQNENPEIRRFAVITMASRLGKKSIPYLCKVMSDKDEMVRYTTILALSSMRSEPAVQAQMKKTAVEDSSVRIQRVANKASWPFQRKTTLLREDASWDHDVVVVKQFQIPQDKWKIKADPKNQGHVAKWYEVKCNDADWLPIKVGTWEAQGIPNYNGYAWYRIRFTMPAKVDCNAVEIHFGSVDESAWIWLNGTYLGDHDFGLDGWNMPFALDCRKEILWGKENILVVRVLDRSGAGGIYKPVSIEILK